MVAADGRGNGYTLAAGARSAQRDTRRVRQNAAAASPVGMMTLRGKLRRHQPRVLLCRRASDPLRTGGTYAVQVTSERSAAEADASFRALRAKFPNQLGGREPIVRRTDSLCVNGKGGWNVPHTAGCRRQLPHSRKLRARSTIGRETAGAHFETPHPSTMNGR
jgi:hypothetical protein